MLHVFGQCSSLSVYLCSSSDLSVVVDYVKLYCLVVTKCIRILERTHHEMKKYVHCCAEFVVCV